MVDHEQVRFFAVVGPKRHGREDSEWWPNVSYAYLSALRAARYDVRAISIGGAYLQVPDDPLWHHWRELQPLFSVSLQENWVNVVCAHPGLSLGKARKLSELVGGASRSISGASPDDVMYVPGTALSNLLTANRINIAISGCFPEPPDDGEVAAMQAYTAVYCPRAEDVMPLRERGVCASHAAPEAFASVLRSYFQRRSNGDSTP